MNSFAVQAQLPTGRIRLADVRRRALLIAQLRVLLIGAVRLLRVAETRSKGMLMLTAAAVIFVNVLIWTL